MARISLQELLALIKESAQYHERWEMEVPVEQALYIRFDGFDEGGERRGLESEVLEMVGGRELIVDRDASGKVVGIEIV